MSKRPMVGLVVFGVVASAGISALANVTTTQLTTNDTTQQRGQQGVLDTSNAASQQQVQQRATGTANTAGSEAVQPSSNMNGMGAPSGSMQSGTQSQANMQFGQQPIGGGPATQSPPASGSSSQTSGSQQPITGTLHVNREFSFAAGNGCQYSGNIHGTIRAAQTRAVQDPNQQGLLPNLTVGAMLTCPNENVISVNDVPIQTPIARAELVRRIQLRASVLSDRTGLHCAFVPDVALDAQGITVRGVSHLCPAPPSATGGGALPSLQ